jgi:hypothetical protein
MNVELKLAIPFFQTFKLCSTEGQQRITLEAIEKVNET